MELARRLGCGPIVAFSEGCIELYRAALVLIILVLEDKPVMNILKLVLLSLLRLTALFIYIWSLPDPIAARVDGRTSVPASDGAQEGLGTIAQASRMLVLMLVTRLECKERR